METVIIRPTSDVGGAGILKPQPSSPATFYDKVNEVTPDNTNYISQNQSNLSYRDFGMADLTGYSGNISNVRVYMRVQAIATQGGPYTMSYQSRVNLTDKGTNINKNTVPVGQNNWETNYQDWAVNPSTGLAFTWADINNLVVGFKTSANNNKCTQYLTQVYAEITYTLPQPVTIIQGCIVQGCVIS